MLDENTRREIGNASWKMLREAGISEPPVSVEQVLAHLELNRKFYDLQDPSFLDRAKHKIIISGRKMLDIVKKINLVAVLLFDENLVVVDEGLPDPKREWSSFHEAAHRVLPWHKPYFFGDTAQTLNPDWQQRFEAEANYGASTMMFCGPVFTHESRDMPPGWGSVAALQKRYCKSYHTTARRYVEEGPDHPMVLLVSTAPWDDKPTDQETRCRHFIRSRLFAERFGTVRSAEVLTQVDTNVFRKRGGPVGKFAMGLTDDNGDRQEFLAECFYNRYYIMTLAVQVDTLMGPRIIVPGSSEDCIR